MIGVVLWADREDSRAVVWCADQGRLAYYDSASETAGPPPSLDAGDVIRFELRDEAPRRIVANPRLIEEGGFPEIADNLHRAAAPRGLTRAAACDAPQSAEIIAFPT